MHCLSLLDPTPLAVGTAVGLVVGTTVGVVPIAVVTTAVLLVTEEIILFVMFAFDPSDSHTQYSFFE